MKTYTVLLNKFLEAGQPIYQIAIAATGPTAAPMATTNYSTWDDIEIALRDVLKLSEIAIGDLAKRDAERWHQGFELKLDDATATTLGWKV